LYIGIRGLIYWLIFQAATQNMQHEVRGQKSNNQDFVEPDLQKCVGGGTETNFIMHITFRQPTTQ